MKKNKMMRLASSLLVAVLLTSSVISGTFAKYVTSDHAEDSARIAKFGVVVTAEGSLFENTYKDAPANDDTVTVSSSTNVVAPGTNNASDAFTFKIVGTPEVDVKIDVKVTSYKDIVLATGTYDDKTQTDSGTFEVTEDYHPVRYSLYNGAEYAKYLGNDVRDVKLSELVTILQSLSVAKVDAGTDLSTIFKDYEITWKWAYENTATEEAKKYTDKCDTYLGWLASEDETADAVKTHLNIEITVTQLD